MRLNNYSYNCRFPKLTLKKSYYTRQYIIIMQLAAAKQLAYNGVPLSILRAFHESYTHSTGPGSGPGPGSIIIRCKNEY